MKNIDKKIKDSTLRLEASHRGGGIEISLDAFGFKGEKMTAFQSYLGGGMLGKIQNDCTIKEWHTDKLQEIAEQLARYFHNITNHSDDEFESQSFEQNQNMPSSAY